MKKMVPALLCLALSTNIYAQSYENCSDEALLSGIETGTSSLALSPDGSLTADNGSNDGHILYLPSDSFLAGHDLNNRFYSTGNHTSLLYNKNSLSAASYTTAIGIRFGGYESGLSIKHFISSSAAIEGIISTGWRYHGTRITGLYELHKAIDGAPGLSFFYGVGAHIGFYNKSYWYNGKCDGGRYEYKGQWYDCDGNRATVGIDGILGLEYHFTEIPFTLGLDIKPSIDLIGRGSHIGDGALTIRYHF